jgi:hypothetical protein
MTATLINNFQNFRLHFLCQHFLNSILNNSKIVNFLKTKSQNGIFIYNVCEHLFYIRFEYKKANYRYSNNLIEQIKDSML